MLTPEMVRCFCIGNNYFTRGDNEQYEKMFDMVRNGEPTTAIAIVIWICSETEKSYDTIRRELELLRLQNARETM